MRFATVSVLSVLAALSACSPGADSSASAILISDVADTSCEQQSSLAGRPAAWETQCRVTDAELQAEVNTAFSTQRECSGLSVVTMESDSRTVPGFVLSVHRWSGPDGHAVPEWQWTLNGAKFSGKASTTEAMVREVCRVVRQSGARVE